MPCGAMRWRGRNEGLEWRPDRPACGSSGHGGRRRQGGDVAKPASSVVWPGPLNQWTCRVQWLVRGGVKGCGTQQIGAAAGYLETDGDAQGGSKRVLLRV